MPSATLPEIEAALLARLRTRLRTATPPGEFANVDRWPGQFSAESEIDAATLGKAPAALLAYEGFSVDGPNGELAETILDDGETVLRHAFLVCVIIKDHRPNAARSVQSNVGQPGILACDSAVIAALAAVRIPGLYQGESVRLSGARPWKTLPGGGVAHLVRVTARALLDTDEAEAFGEPASVPFEGMDGTNGPEDALDLDASTLDLL